MNEIFLQFTNLFPAGFIFAVFGFFITIGVLLALMESFEV